MFYDRQQHKVSIKNIVKTSTLDFAENVVAATNLANLVRLFKGYQTFPSPFEDGFKVMVGGLEGSIKSP